MQSSVAGVKRENLTLKSLQLLAVSEESEIRILITMRVKPFRAIISAGAKHSQYFYVERDSISLLFFLAR